MTQDIFSNNNLQNNGFTFALERIPQTLFRVVSCELPGINVPDPEEASGRSLQRFPGTANDFDPLTMEFLLDEDMKNYEEIYRWITQQMQTNTEFAPIDREKYLVSDGTLITMNNASVPNRSFHFKDMFPIALGSIRFNTNVSQPEPITCQVVFQYAYFTLKPKT